MLGRMPYGGDVMHIFRNDFFFAVIVFVLLAAGRPDLVGASIYEWEYIDPGNPSLGKQQSANLLTNLSAEAGIDFPFISLRKAYLRDAVLNDAVLEDIDLTQAYLAGAQLRGADAWGTIFAKADLAGVDFTGAFISQSQFTDTTSSGFTQQQLVSTASYSRGYLSRVWLDRNDLSGWDLSDQIIDYSRFNHSTMIGADLSGSQLTGAKFISTDLGQADLSSATLVYADLSSTNLLDAVLFGADLRAATGVSQAEINSASDTRNLIYPDGSMSGGLHIESGETLMIRDEPTSQLVSSPVPDLVVHDVFKMKEGSTLRLQAQRNLISLRNGRIYMAPSVGEVYLAGTLELMWDSVIFSNFAYGFGRSSQIFSWGDALIHGEFDDIVVDPKFEENGYSLDTSEIYSTGRIRVLGGNIPEPSTSVLIGLLGFGWLGRRSWKRD